MAEYENSLFSLNFYETMAPQGEGKLRHPKIRARVQKDGYESLKKRERYAPALINRKSKVYCVISK